MRVRMILLTPAAFCCLAWAATDAASRPQQRDNAAAAGRPVANAADAIVIPRMLSYQGKLTDTFGIPVPDTTYQVTFRLYTGPSGGTPFWTETQTVKAVGGLFSVLLGSVTPVDSVPQAGNCWLGTQVGSGSELTPRLRIAAGAYSFLAGMSANSELLQGKDTVALDARYIGEGQAAAGDLAGTYPNPAIAQKNATTGQVLKWIGSAWEPANDSVGQGGSGTVTSAGQAPGVACMPNPITITGSVGLDTTYSDTRYVNEGQANSVTSAMIVGK